MIKKHRVQFIGRVRFLSSSLLSLVDNLAEGIRNNKCKDRKSCLVYGEVKDKNY